MIQMKAMGGLSGLMDKLPWIQNPPANIISQVDSSEFTKLEAIINSMTISERRFPAAVNSSRKKRIANGSGTQIQDVNRLLKQHKQMQKMMKKLSKKRGLANLTRGKCSILSPGFQPR